MAVTVQALESAASTPKATYTLTSSGDTIQSAMFWRKNLAKSGAIPNNQCYKRLETAKLTYVDAVVIAVSSMYAMAICVLEPKRCTATFGHPIPPVI
jgi:hypothetical protein